jgi:hypothetical protein
VLEFRHRISRHDAARNELPDSHGNAVMDEELGAHEKGQRNEQTRVHICIEQKWLLDATPRRASDDRKDQQRNPCQ